MNMKLSLLLASVILLVMPAIGATKVVWKTNYVYLTNVVWVTNINIQTVFVTNVVWVTNLFQTGSVFVSPYGNDFTAIRGSSNNPCKTLARALFISEGGDTLYLSGGVFDCNDLYVSNRNITGSGPATRLICGQSSLGIGIAGNCNLSDFTILSTNSWGGFVFPVCTVTTNNLSVTMNRVAITGQSDCLSVGGGPGNIQFTVNDCAFGSKYDSVVYSSDNPASLLTLNRCVMRSERDPYLFGEYVRALAVNRGRINVVNCSLGASGGEQETLGVYNIAGDLRLEATTIAVASPQGLVRILYQDGGKTSVFGMAYDPLLITVMGGSVEFNP
jgi:hypothetical protein